MERANRFAPGDNVEVAEGELINLQGKVMTVQGNKVMMMPKHDELSVRRGYCGRSCLFVDYSSANIK